MIQVQLLIDQKDFMILVLDNISLQNSAKVRYALIDLFKALVKDVK